jgi:hypothetical protein
MKLTRVYTQFMIAFFVFVSLPCIFRPLTDSPKPGLFLGKDTANAFGLFRINWFHAVLHMALAVVGLAALRDDRLSKPFAQLNFVSCAALVGVGLATENGTKHVPANPLDDVVNAAVGAAGFVVGFTPLADLEIRQS